MTDANVTEVRTYTIQVSWDNYRDDHNYNRMGEYPFSPKSNSRIKGQEYFASLEQAIEAIETSYGDKSTNSFVAYWVHETITSTTVEVLDERRTVTTVVTAVERDAYVHFRSAEDIEKYVDAPYRKHEAERVASGEVALELAYQEELAENHNRRDAGEPQVYTAERAWLEFHDYSIPSYIIEAETIAREGFFGRLKRTLAS